MRNQLFASLAILLSLAAPSFAKPWLEVAELYVPAIVSEEDRYSARCSLVHSYAHYGEFARAQALLDACEADTKPGMGVLATMGALEGGYIDQARHWGKLYLSANEHRASPPGGTDRERFLRSAPTPEVAAFALAFLRERGGVSPSSLSFVLREIGGMPLAVSDFYLREFAKARDAAKPRDWLQIGETVEASGPEFAPLRKELLEILLANQATLVEELAGPSSRASDPVPAVKRYLALLLARQGRFEEADQLWAATGPDQVDERKAFLQSQYLGGRRTEAMRELTKISGMEEDARLGLSLFLKSLNHFEESKALGVDPEDYLDVRTARMDLQRGLNVDKWLDYAAGLDAEREPRDSVLWSFSRDWYIPEAVREKARARVPNPSLCEEAIQDEFRESLEQIQQSDKSDVALELLVLDSEIQRSGIQPGPEALALLEKLRRKAPGL